MVLPRNDAKRQRELRKSIADRVKSSPNHTVDRVARDFGVSPSVVYRACAEHGVSLTRTVNPDPIDDPIAILGRLVHAEDCATVADLARNMGLPARHVEDVLQRARKHHIPLGRWDDTESADVEIVTERNGAPAAT